MGWPVPERTRSMLAQTTPTTFLAYRSSKPHGPAGRDCPQTSAILWRRRNCRFTAPAESNLRQGSTLRSAIRRQTAPLPARTRLRSANRPNTSSRPPGDASQTAAHAAAKTRQPAVTRRTESCPRSANAAPKSTRPPSVDVTRRGQIVFATSEVQPAAHAAAKTRQPAVTRRTESCPRSANAAPKPAVDDTRRRLIVFATSEVQPVAQPMLGTSAPRPSNRMSSPATPIGAEQRERDFGPERDHGDERRNRHKHDRPVHGHEGVARTGGIRL